MDNGGCSPGRMCHNGVCVCGEASMCKSYHGVSVCGSDGQLYPSHCELHRQACLKQIHIRVNRNGQCGQDIQTIFKVQPIYGGRVNTSWVESSKYSQSMKVGLIHHGYRVQSSANL